MLQLQAGEAVGAWGKRLQKLLHRTGFTPCGQHVESKAIADVQQGLHRPVFRYGHSEARRREAGLAHPAGHHGAAEAVAALPFAGGEHAKGAHHPAQGLHCRVAAALAESATGASALHLALFALQLAAQGGAGFLDGFEVGRIGAELHLDRFKGELEAAIAQLALQQIQGFTAPAKAAKDPNRLAAVALS